MKKTLKSLLVVLITGFLPLFWTLNSLALVNFSEKSRSELNIFFRERAIGSVEKFEVTGDKEDPSRLLITSTVQLGLDSLLSQLDATMTGRGNLIEGCSQRLYWRNGTAIRHGGQILGLTSKIRYEQWTCTDLIFDTLKTKLFSVSTDVEWKLFVESKGLDKLKIIAEVTNVKNVPPFVEERLGLRIRNDIEIPIPTNCGTCDCTDIAQTLDVEFRSVNFETIDNTLRVVIQFSAKGDLTELFGCL